MPELVIGHATDHSATVWLRGERRLRWAQVAVTDPAGARVDSCRVRLDPERDFTGVAPLGARLEASTQYRVTAHFGRTRWSRANGSPVEGRFRTFPQADSDTPFSFLLGSCNLSTARLSSLGGLLAGFIGLIAAHASLTRPASWLKRTWRGLVSVLDAWLFRYVMRTTHFEIPPVLASPIEALGDREPAFMIHAGDQIYFDVGFPKPEPELRAYRRAYRQAWFDDPHYAGLLSRCPHYMVLDDHEIVDAFGNTREQAKYRAPALRAYREYVHDRNPKRIDENELFYDFCHGRTPFFVLDTRTQREAGKMIGDKQMTALESWLSQDPGCLKFVVSSVPFVAEVVDEGESDENQRPDKWCGPAFSAQREQIIELAHEKGIRRLVFLVGDMHCTYHASMRVGEPGDRVTLHELGAGPIHQLLFARREQFHGHYPSRTLRRGVPFTTWMRSFNGAAASVMEIRVLPGAPPRLEWEAVPTRRAEASHAIRPTAGEIRF